MDNIKLFDNLKKDIYNNKNKILKLLEEESKKFYFMDKNNIFVKRKYDVKTIFKDNKELWWEFNKFSRTVKDKELNKDNKIIEEVTSNGLGVVKNYFDDNFIQQTKDIIFDEIKKREYFLNNKGLTDNNTSIWIDDTKSSGRIYNRHSKYDGRDRVWFTDEKKAPSLIKELFNNELFLETVSNYFGCKSYPNAIVGEHLYAPYIPRNDLYWHIDVLKDQFKIMISLSDVKEGCGEFIYIPKTHKWIDRYKNRYHTIYKSYGINTTNTYFEDDFIEINKLERALLKKGDVAFFDTQIYHSWSYPKPGKERINLVVYFQEIPSFRNRVFKYIE